jgi:hypothetical protein
MQMVQLFATKCSYIATLWVSVVGFAAITLCVAPQRVFIVVKRTYRYRLSPDILDTPSYIMCKVFKQQETVLKLDNST